LGLSDNVVSVTAVTESDYSIDGAFEKLDFLEFAHSASFFDRGEFNSGSMVFLIELKISDGTVVHGIF
jgi:hypothetical protein